MSVKILEGDCVEVMRSMDEASVDAIVCDPPYGLEFMGKEWDRLWDKREASEHKRPENKGQTASPFISAHVRWYQKDNAAMQAWHEAWAREALRVLKPGGHMLAFSGSRTYHRLACAVEDAGFEIRDMVEWFYGSGFPKSLNVGKAIDKMARGDLARQKIKHFREKRGWTQWELGSRAELADPIKTLWDWEEGGHNPGDKNWQKIRAILKVSDEEEAEFEREVIGRSANGLAPRWVENGDAGYKTEFDITAPATEAAQQWDGWGSALKPAHEPIVLARKPLAESSIARQVLSTGTGAINVDASRVAGTVDAGWNKTKGSGPKFVGNTYNGGKEYPESQDAFTPSDSGRFPANLVFSHSVDCVRIGERRVKGDGHVPKQRTPNAIYGGGKGTNLEQHERYLADESGMETVEAYECHPSCSVAELDRQSGTSKHGRESTNGSATSIGGNGAYHGANGQGNKIRHDTEGGASRFFKTFDAEPRFAYIPKSSRRERNAGLEGMPEHQGGAYNTNGHNGMPGRTFKDGEWVNTGTLDEPNRKARANNHPTVKPIALMRYLVRLITPPGGTVLDPFMGSGSTGCAAVLEGFDFIGIERDEEYCAIARRRIEHWSLPEDERPNGKPGKARNTYGFKSTDVLRRCPEHGESIPSGSTLYKCGCEKVWHKVEAADVPGTGKEDELTLPLDA